MFSPFLLSPTPWRPSCWPAVRPWRSSAGTLGAVAMEELRGGARQRPWKILCGRCGGARAGVLCTAAMEEPGGGARRGGHGGAPRERSAAALVELTRGALGAAMEELAPGVHGAAATTSYVAAGHARPQIRWSGANIQPRRAKMQQRAGGGLCGGRTTNMERMAFSGCSS